MPKPFDVTLKELISARPADWLKLLGLPPGAAMLVDADLATISTEADRVLRVDAPQPYIAHVEFQSTYEDDMIERFLRYYVLLRFRHKILVRTTVLLLRREADRPEFVTGVLRDEDPLSDEPTLLFRYNVVRLWEVPVDTVLAAGNAALPLAPLAKVSPDQLPALITRMDTQLQTEATSDRRRFWTSVYILLGLKYPLEFSKQLLRGVQQMTDSVTYMDILNQGVSKGRSEGARETILRMGRKRFGEASVRVTEALERITDMEALEQIAERLLEVESWTELLPEAA